MTSLAMQEVEPAPILACTVADAIEDFDILIDAMENLFGEAWGNLGYEDVIRFLEQPDAATLEWLIIVARGEQEADEKTNAIIRAARQHQVEVILVSGAISPERLGELKQEGVSVCLAHPIQPGDLEAVIENARAPMDEAADAIVETALDRPAESRLQITAAAMPAAEPPPSEKSPESRPELAALPALAPTGSRRGMLLPVHGMAGGAGASTFATNLAWELVISNKKERRVCLIDLGFQFGSVATYLDLPRREAPLEILTDPHSLDADSLIRSMQMFNDKLAVFTAPPDMLPLDIISGEDLGRLIDLALANFDFVVVDMPSTVVSWTEAVLSRAAAYFILMNLDLRSAQNTLRFIRALKAEALPLEKLRYVLNRAPKFTDLSARARAKRMAESLDIKIEIQLPDGAGQVAQANDHGLPLAERGAKNALRKELQKLAKSLVEQSGAASVSHA